MGSSFGNLVRQVGLVTTIPMLFAAGPLVGYFFGQWIDRRFGTEPWGTIALALLGFGAGLKQVIAVIRRWISEDPENKE